MTQAYDIILNHKWFSVPLTAMLLALLIRIPMGTFSTPSEVDLLSHFVLIAAGAPLVIVWLVRNHLLPVFRSRSHFVFITTLVGICIEVAWEIFEFSVDGLIGLSWQISNADTMVDIILGVIGAVCGAVVFAKIYGIIDKNILVKESS